MVRVVQQVSPMRRMAEYKNFTDLESFQFRKDRPYHWLQKAAIWVLKSLRCFRPYTMESQVWITIDTENLSRSIFEQDRWLFDMYYERGEHVLMGPQEYAELRSCDPITHPITFDVPFKYYDPKRSGLPMSLDMKVTVVPWMKGILVLPKNWRGADATGLK